MEKTRSIRIIKDSKGREIYVEVSPDIKTEFQKEEESKFVPIKKKDDRDIYIQELDKAIYNTSQMVLDGITQLETTLVPKKVGLEFGLELGAEGKIWFIAKGSVKTSIKVSIEWDLSDIHTSENSDVKNG